MFQKINSSYAIYKRLLKYVKPYRSLIITIIICSILNAAAGIISPISMKNLINIAIAKKYDEFFGIFFYLLMFSVAINIIISCIKTYASGIFSSFVARDMRNEMVRRVQNLPVSYLESRNLGDMVSCVNNDMSLVSGILNCFSILIYQPLVFVSAIFIALAISWKLLLVVAIIFPFIIKINYKISKPFSKYGDELQKEHAAANSVVQDTIEGINVIKAFNIKDAFIEKYLNRIKRIVFWEIKIERKYIFANVLKIVLIVMPVILINCFGSYLIIKNEITMGDFIIYLTLINYMTEPINSINGAILGIRQAKGALLRIMEILDQPIEAKSGCTLKISTQKPAIEFKNVSFSYNGKYKILNNMSFSIPQGKIAAIVGQSGSGKSTIIKLICGFYQLQEGCVELFGNDLSKTKISEIRETISVVLQDTYVYPVSVFENILYGQASATEEEIYRAAREANAHEFIVNMENGYSTIIGEKGVKLSGGQKQRITLARAILRRAPLLILDEPSASLDFQSEMLFQDALERHANDKTILVIAHRMSTIKKANIIFVVDKGAIAEAGTHEELMERKNIYYQLVTSQNLSSISGCY